MRDTRQYHHAKSAFIPAVTIAILVTTASVLASAGALYKWIDENGQVRYSDRLPAEQVRKQHQQLNSQGVVLTTKEAAKSDEELAAEAEAKRKQQEQAAEEARLKELQDKKDQVLLLTFSSEKELELARDSRIQVIDSVIRLIQNSIESTRETLEQLEASAERNFTSQGLEVPGGLAQKIEHFSQKLVSRNEQLALKEKEKEKINGQYDRDVERYRLLKSEAD
ncbi:MAG: DUF4124 domain-containing protein [Gammaproteobacteria bacterium]|nr:DUF4124 domain-containing protein [Gammaproteobacteria bacterium]MDH3537166.1 DUF4124 domain-containing protein [Gammaproteobacteria bacterium]